MADIQTFINQHNGEVGLGDTPQNDGQCVGLVEVWLDVNGWPHIWGNACDLPANADRGVYDIIPNTQEYVPPAGAIGVLPAGWGGSEVGHTFIVAPGTTQETLVVFEQNDRIGGGDGRVRLFNGIGWPDGLVFIVPKVLDAPAPAPQPAPAPAPTPDPQPAATPAPTPAPAPVSSSAPVSSTDTPSNFNSDNLLASTNGTSTRASSQDVQSATSDISSQKSATDTVGSADSVPPTNLVPATTMPTVERLLMQITKRMHDILMVAAAVFAVGGALVNYLNSVESVSLMGLVVAIAGALEHARITSP